MGSIFSDADVEVRFRRDGYVVQPLLDVEEIKALYDLYQSTPLDVPSDFYSTVDSPDALYRETIRQGVNAILIPRLKSLMPHYYPCMSAHIVKRGNGQGYVPAHHDYSMVDYDQHTAVHIWCPLIDVDETNGCLKAVIGSHRLFNHIGAVTGNPTPYDSVRKLLAEEYSLRVPMPAGSVFIFDERLLHCSDENQTDCLRIAVGGVMIPKGVAPLLYMWDEEKPEQLTVLEVTVDYLTQFKLGALITEPYPQGVKFIKTIPYEVVPISADDINSLYLSAAKVADSLGKHSTSIEANNQPDNSQPRTKPDLLGSSSNESNRWFNYKTLIGELFLSLSKIVRQDNWWLYKIPPLLAVAYAEILLMDIPFNQAILTIFYTIFISVFAAGYGHIVNDIFDVEIDSKVGKSNAMAQLMPWQRFLFCLLFIIGGFAVPILMKLGNLLIILLVIAYLIPTLYSVPPFRFKEKGIWGIVCDAAGAHVVPTIFVATIFCNLSLEVPPIALTFSIVAAGWACFLGLRGILLHQLWDRENDINSGIVTFATQFHPESIRHWINNFLFPAEISLFGCLVIVLSQSAQPLLAFSAIYVMFTFAKLKIAQTPLDPSPPANKNIVPHDLYEVWFPLALSVLLATRDPLFLTFVVMTLVLFYPSIKVRGTEVFDVLKSIFNFGEKERLHALLTDAQQQLEEVQQTSAIDRYQLSQARSHIEELEAQLHETKGQLVHAQTEFAQKIVEAKQQLEEVQQTSETNCQQLSQARSHIEELETQLHETQEQLEYTQTEFVRKIVEATQQLEEVQQASEIEHQQLSQARSHIEELETQFYETQKQLEYTQTEFVRKIVEATQQLEEVQQASAIDRYQLNQARSHIEELETQLYETKEQLSQEMAELAEKNAELQNIKFQQHQVRLMSIIRERSHHVSP